MTGMIRRDCARSSFQLHHPDCFSGVNKAVFTPLTNCASTQRSPGGPPRGPPLHDTEIMREVLDMLLDLVLDLHENFKVQP